jgi:hypothetical protein
MRKAFTCVVILILIANMQLILLTAQGYSGSQIALPLLTKPVTVDGKWTAADEWSDAVVITLINCNCSNATANGYLYAKHDPSNFYFLIDFTSSTVLDVTYDGASVMIDPLHSGGTVPQSDDREFVAFSNGGSMSVGTGIRGNEWSLNNPLPQEVKVAFSMASSSNQAKPHEIAEFLLPFSIFPGMQNTLGFSVAARHGNFGSQFSLALWPANRAREDLSTWGELTISPTPIQEFPYLWSIIAATLLVSVTLTWSRRKASPKGLV